MSATRMILAAVVLGLSAAPAVAQTPGRTGGDPFEPGAGKPKELDGKQLRQMYEDVAVFGKLLNRAVEKSYGLSSQAPVHGAHGPGAAFHQFSLAEGVYLPGRGVVYTLSAPPPAQGPLETGGDAAAKEPSDWERARQELRGDKPAPPRNQAPRRPSLSEAVLRLLAENGQHFKELAAGEQITVAITFRGGDCVQCHAASNRRGLFQGSVEYGKVFGQSAQYYPTGPYPLKMTAPAVSVGGQVASGLPRADREGSVGDLHLRQGRYTEAARAYEQALQVLLREIKPQKTEADVQRLLAAVELTRKLALALSAAGNKEGAERARALSLKYAEAAVKVAESLKGGKTEKGPIALPERLIVSAPKKLLDQAGAGKLNFAEFRKAVRVQHLRFPRAEK